jgi:hypothetical protein
VRFEGCEETIDALGEAIVDYALVLECLYLVSALVAFLVDLRLFGADEGLLVDIGVYFDVAVVRELEGVLEMVSQLRQVLATEMYTYPLAVVNDHFGRADFECAIWLLRYSSLRLLVMVGFKWHVAYGPTRHIENFRPTSPSLFFSKHLHCKVTI